jgi:hypothetical protein
LVEGLSLANVEHREILRAGLKVLDIAQNPIAAGLLPGLAAGGYLENTAVRWTRCVKDTVDSFVGGGEDADRSQPSGALHAKTLHNETPAQPIPECRFVSAPPIVQSRAILRSEDVVKT